MYSFSLLVLTVCCAECMAAQLILGEVAFRFCALFEPNATSSRNHIFTVWATHGYSLRSLRVPLFFVIQ